MSRPFLVIAGVGAVLILAFVGYKLLGSGGGGGTSTASRGSTATTVGPRAGGASTTTTTPAPPVTPKQTFDVFTTKNPFQPVVSVATGTGTGGSTTPPSTQSTTPSSGATTPPATVPANQAPAAGTAVALLEVFDASGTVTARVQVGSTVYTVTAGTTFATSYKVVSIQGSCGQFQFGDSPFQLCVGEQVLK